MSYIVLARKYRPQNFDDLVGQRPVSQTLRNALTSGRVAHAYIFSGPRGIGKTTTARILAKCLNCEKGISMTPCNACESCRAISQGTSVDDVLEIDGASNRGIEQIRELRESAKYTPSKCRYRIFIIDEAHQITKDAFGALLKTLEEPPAHVVFMLATTEVQKIPSPILSRCQRFSLRPIAADLVLKHLKEICAKEKIQADDRALADIVRFVEGSLRDALSLLDQAIVFSPAGVTSETLRDLLGLLPKDVILKLARALHKGEPADILQTIHALVDNGTDLTQLAKDCQEYFHTLLLAKAGVEDPLQVGQDQLKEEAKAYDFPLLERNIRLLGRALDDMRRSEAPRAIFEIAALRMGQRLMDPRLLLERLEALNAQGITAPAASTSAYPRPSLSPTPIFSSRPAAPAPVTAPLPTAALPAAPPPSAAPAAPAATWTEKFAQWPDFINLVGEEKQSLASALEEAQVTVQPNGALLLTFHKTFNQQMVAKSLDLLKPFMIRTFGAALPLETKLDLNAVKTNTDSARPAAPAAARSAAPAPAPAPLNRPALPEDESSALEEIPADQASDDLKKAMKHFPGVLKKGKKK